MGDAQLAQVLARDPFDTVVALLRARGRVRIRSADSVRAQCPAHADHNPSLVVTRLHNRVVVKCFAGCEKLQVLQVLGLTYGDLFYGPRREPTKPQIVAVYSYTDCAGTVIAEKVRTDRKSFFWRMPDGCRGLHDCSVGLYGLHELAEARQVLKVEGEKGVQYLRGLGFAATCGPAGAAQWLPQWGDVLWQLGCSELVILADNDQAGRRHAGAIAESCYGRLGRAENGELEATAPWASWPIARVTDAELAPMQVKIITFPEIVAGGDVVDYLVEHTVDDLRQRIAAQPFWYPGIEEELRIARRREQTKLRVKRLRERQRAERACNATLCQQSSLPDGSGLVTHRMSVRAVTRNAVTPPNVLIDDFTKKLNLSSHPAERLVHSEQEKNRGAVVNNRSKQRRPCQLTARDQAKHSATTPSTQGRSDCKEQPETMRPWADGSEAPSFQPGNRSRSRSASSRDTVPTARSSAPSRAANSQSRALAITADGATPRTLPTATRRAIVATGRRTRSTGR